MWLRPSFLPSVGTVLLVGMARAVSQQLSCPLPLNEVQTDLLSQVSWQIHRNGSPDACGIAQDMMPVMTEILASMGLCEDLTKLDDKYWFEAFLTNVFHSQFQRDQDPSLCSSQDDPDKDGLGFMGYCDMGPERTPPQPDSAKLVRTQHQSLPCRFFTREGVRLATFTQWTEWVQDRHLQHLQDCGQEHTCAAHTPVDLYAVPASRVFMFAPSHVGEIFRLDHVLDSTGNPLYMEVLSLEPRVFDIFHFFSEEEAQTLIDKALKETSKTHRLHRSTTGAVNGTVFSKRTSENAWDTHGKLAQIIKKRCMKALGFDEYHESQTDGLQILRYNLTTAYTPHMDYLDNFDVDPYDYDSAKRGGNRFATILLYMSDLNDEDGGETVFSEAPPIGESALRPAADVIRELRSSGTSLDILKEGSWEEEMAAKCQSRLSVKPYKSRAVLFYSQKPNGELDKLSKHGGCPVLSGTKWAANLWAWNAPRADFSHAPYKPGREPASRWTQIKATFRNSGNDPRFNDAELYYDEDGFFGELGPQKEIRVNTFKTHVWNIVSKSTKEKLKTFTIEDDNSRELLFQV